MDAASNEEVLPDPTAVGSGPLAEIETRVLAITMAQGHVESLVAAIQGQAETAAAKGTEIEQGRLFAEKSRAEIDGQLAATTAAAATLQQQLDSAKSLLTEATNLLANVQTTSKEASNEIATRVGAITAAQAQTDSLMAGVQGQADTAASKNSEIEQGRLFAEKSRADIDVQLAAVTAAVATLQQQVDSAKSMLAEVTNLQTNAQTTSNQTVEVKAQAGAALQSLQTLLATASDNGGRIEAIKTNAEQTQAVIATKSEHIEGGRVHADKVRGEIDRLFTEAQLSSTNAEAQHQASRAVVDNLNTLYVSAQTVKADTDSNANIVEKLRQQCEEDAATAKKLADIADVTHQRVSEYEARLAELQNTADERLKTIEGLLPGAASAGLASAFNQRRTHFTWPQRIWQTVFVGSLVALFVIALLEFNWYTKPNAVLTWDGLGLSLLHRLPFALPLIWLAFHASHKAALAQRVEEDYAFKETVSRSFEGYRREMAELEGKAAPESALSRLCAGVLSVITNPPGRIYEKHQLNKTPLNAIAESAGPLVNAASKLTPGQIKVGN